MKKFLALLIFLSASSVYATCSIDADKESVCSLPEFREQMSPIFKQSSGVPTNIDSPAGQLQPLNRADPIDQMRGPNNNLNYSSGCQFGVCLQNPKDSRLPDNKDIGN